MGDLLGSPRVAPLFLALTGIILACHLSSQWARPFPSPSAPSYRRSEHPIERYGPSKLRVRDFSPFSGTWKIPSFKDDRRKRQAFWTAEGHGTGDNRIEAIRKGGLKRTTTQEHDVAIIPALMHRIPSELRSLACLGESNTRMSDILGSPRVGTPLFGSYGYYSGLPLVVPMGSALPIAIGAGLSSIRASDRKIRAVEIARLRLLPVFCDMEDPIVRERSTETASFLDGRGAWNGR